MRPQRQVRRTEVRPTYARRRQAQRSRPQLHIPAVKIAWIRLAAVITVILGLLVGFAHLTTVNAVVIQGNKTLAGDHLQRVAEEGLSRQWFGRNLMLVNTGGLASYIEKAEPGIKAADVHRQPFHEVVVSVTERQPTINWKTNGEVYLLDVDATVIGPTKGVYTKLPTVSDSSNLPVKVGDRVAPTSFVAFCAEIARILPPAGFEVGEMNVQTTTSEVTVKSTKGIMLKFDTTRPAGDEVQDLKLVQAELTKAKKTPTQYIDLRIEHKAYYK